MKRSLSLLVMSLLSACGPAGELVSASSGTSFHIPTARIQVDAAVGLDLSAAPSAPGALGTAKLALLGAGATEVTRPHGANGLFVVVATPELGAANQDVSIGLDGAQANDPASPVGTLGDDGTKSLGPSCSLPDATPAIASLRLLDLTAQPAPQTAPAATDEGFAVIHAGLPAPAGKPYDETQIVGHRLYTGEHCQVYVDKAASDSADTASAVAEVGQAFDQTIYPTDTKLFGSEPNPGIDGDPRIFIVVTPEVSAHGKTGTLAYFARRDLAFRGDGQPSHVHSNQKEVLFVDTTALLPGRRGDLLASVAHEFQHLIHFHQKAHVAGVTGGEERWLDEACAMVASDACGYGVQKSPNMYQHVQGYLQTAYNFSLTDWPGNPNGQGYGIGFLFLSYLQDRFGKDLIPALITSHDTGKANLDARLRERGSSYPQAFADFAVALAVSGLLPDGDHGRFAFTTVPDRATTPFGTLEGPAAIRLGTQGGKLPRHADTAYLLHLRPGAGTGDLTVRTAGGPFFGAVLTP